MLTARDRPVHGSSEAPNLTPCVRTVRLPIEPVDYRWDEMYGDYIYEHARPCTEHAIGRRRTARAVAHRAATRRIWDTHRTSYSYSTVRTSYSYSQSSHGAQAQRHRESAPRDECSHRQAYMQTQRAERVGGWGDSKATRQRTLLRHAGCFCKVNGTCSGNSVWHSVSVWHTVPYCSCL